RSAGPAGTPRGLLAGGVTAASLDGNRRRQPAAGHAVLVLAPRVRLLAARRRAVLREGRCPSRARDLRQRALRLRASVRRRGGAARARSNSPHNPPGAADRRALPPSDG